MNESILLTEVEIVAICFFVMIVYLLVMEWR